MVVCGLNQVMRHRFCFALLCILLSFSLFSCQKEGVFLPKKKLIQRNCYAMGYPEAITSYDYIWDDDLLVGIKGTGTTFELSYDDQHRLSQVVCNEEVAVYHYQKKLLNAIDYYVGDSLYYTIRVKHEGKKISGYGYLLNVYVKSLEESKLRPLILGDEASRVFADMENSKYVHGEGSYYYGADFVWDGDDISQVIYTESITPSYRFIGQISTQKYTYTYEKLKNPFHGLLTIEGLGVANLSAHCASSVNDGDVYVTNFTYESKGKFPVRRTSSDGAVEEYVYEE